MLSQKCKYAIRAVIYLSSDFPEPTKKGGKETSSAINSIGKEGSSSSTNFSSTMLFIF